MAIIINIETSGAICSVAVTKDGLVDFQLEDTQGMKHAERLAPFLDECLQHLKRKGERPDAVAVSIGPGSYTGLRIGLSAAKGLAFALDIPLIGVDTLKILAVKAMFRPGLILDENDILLPMIDARRMEVYTAAYDMALNAIIEPTPVILEPDSFSRLQNHKIIVMGDGAMKAKGILDIKGEFLTDIRAHAKDMLALSEKAYRERDFLDLAYSVPLYLKAYQATTPKNKVIDPDAMLKSF